MSAQLITSRQVVDRPVLLIINLDGADQYLNPITQLRHDFDIEVEAYGQLTQSDQALAVLTASLEVAHKVLLVGRLDSLWQWRRAAAMVALRRHPRLYVLATTHSPLAGELPEPWSRLFDAQRLAEEVSAEFSRASVILAENVVVEASPWNYPSPLGMAIAQLPGGTVVFPDILWSHQSDVMLLPAVARLLRAPHQLGVYHPVGLKQAMLSSIESAVQLYSTLHSTAQINLQSFEAAVQPELGGSLINTGQLPTLPITRFLESLPQPGVSFSPSWLPVPPPPSKPHVHHRLNTSPKPENPQPKPTEANLTVLTRPTHAWDGVTAKNAELSPRPPRPKVHVDVSAQLASLFSHNRVQQKSQLFAATGKSQLVARSKSRRRRLLFGGGVLSVAAAAMILLAGVGYQLTERWLRERIGAVISSGIDNPTTINSLLAKPSDLLSRQTKLYSSVVDTELFTGGLVALRLSTQLQTAQQSLASLRQVAQTNLGNVLGGSPDKPDLTALTEKLTAAAASLEDLSPSVEQLELPRATAQSTSKFTEWINQQQKALAIGQRLSPHLPTLLGKSGKKVYAVAFLNNQEMRPSGGFLHTVGLITFQDGRLTSTQAFNVYDLDARVTGVVVPPELVRRYLNETQWFLHDSLVEPHFPDAAKQLSWFIDKGLNQQVDGVLAITTPSLADLIGAVGPLELPDFNEVVTANNLAERFEFHSSVQLPTGTRDRDFSRAVVTKFFTQLQALPEDKTLSLLSALWKNLLRSEAMIYVTEPNLAAELSRLTWTGAILQPECPPQFAGSSCRVDTFVQAELNTGVNKANAYLERVIAHDVELSTATAHHTRTITYRNTAQTEAWPKGPYSALIRFYLPTDAQQVTLYRDDQAVPANELFLETTYNRQVVGVPIRVGVQSSLNLKLTFMTPLTSSTQAYVFFDQKMPGYPETPYTLNLIYPPDRKPKLVAPQVELLPDRAIFNNLFDQHVFAGMMFP